MKIEPDKLVSMYRKMVTIRLFEEAIWDVYTRALMPGIAHLCIGQEAVAVGVCSALQTEDYIISNHRGHGHCIAKDSNINRMMAEILGKDTGYCRGKGGTMHISDGEHRNLGATGIVGAGIGLAVGVGLTIKLKQLGAISLCFFGEGASNEGIFHESLNLAAIWKLPVIFLCENNQYGEYTAATKVTAGEQISDRARALSVPSVIVDGMDVMAVYDAVWKAVERARAGEGPAMVEAMTYRYKGHHVGDPGKYRPPEEVDQWMKRDPIPAFGKRLLELGVITEEQLSSIAVEVGREVEEAVEFAKTSPVPSIEQVFEDIYQ